MQEVFQGDTKESIFDVSFLSTGGYLWDRKIYDKVFKSFNNFEENEVKEVKQEEFKILTLEFKMAHRKFLQEVQDLSFIVKCRNKGDNDSHFGGQECAEFAKNIRNSCEKYLSNSKSKEIKEENLSYFIKQIRDKAKCDETYAWNFEKNTKQIYNIDGKDNTMNIFKNL